MTRSFAFSIAIARRLLLNWSSWLYLNGHVASSFWRVAAMNSPIVDRDLRGDLAGGVSAHAVRDDEETLGLVEGVGVLVVLALAADVGEAERVDGSHLLHQVRPARWLRISSSALRASPADGSQRSAS